MPQRRGAGRSTRLALLSVILLLGVGPTVRAQALQQVRLVYFWPVRRRCRSSASRRRW